jgi:hypothetical protein
MKELNPLMDDNSIDDLINEIKDEQSVGNNLTPTETTTPGQEMM